MRAPRFELFDHSCDLLQLTRLRDLELRAKRIAYGKALARISTGNKTMVLEVLPTRLLICSVVAVIGFESFSGFIDPNSNTWVLRSAVSAPVEGLERYLERQEATE